MCKKLKEKWHFCTGCDQWKTINFKPNETLKKFKCECGKTEDVSFDSLKSSSGFYLNSYKYNLNENFSPPVIIPKEKK